MTIIINVLGNGCIQSDTVDSVTAQNVMRECNCFASEHCVMPEEIFIIASDKLIEIDLESVIQSELKKQLQEKQYEKN